MERLVVSVAPVVDPLQGVTSSDGCSPVPNERAVRSSIRTPSLGRLSLDGIVLVSVTLLARGADPALNLAVALMSLATFVLLLMRTARVTTLRLEPLDEARAAFSASTLAVMSITTGAAFLGEASTASALATPWLLTTGLLVAGRAAGAQLELRQRRTTARRTLVIGAGRVGRLTARRLAADSSYALRPVGFLDNEPLESTDEDDVPVLGASWDFDRVVAEHGIEHVVVTFSTAPHHVLLRIARRCEDLAIPVSVVPRLYERMSERAAIEHLGGIAFVTAVTQDPSGLRFRVKYAIDRVLAAVLLLLVSPVFVAAAASTWLSLGRPLFFRQERIGLNGRPFSMLKFRSMREGTGGAPKIELAPDMAPGGVEGDDRRTRVGTFLRKTSLDELPQLLNVVRGDMSLIGPRPERPEFVDRFSRDVYRYDDRHRAKAGITGWAQVNGLRGKTSITDRAEWDNYYIENRSFWLDTKILARTVGAVFRTARVE